MTAPDRLTIGQVSERSGVAASALRYYEDEGLIRSERADSGHRRYRRDVLRRVAFIKVAQMVGLSLEEIRDALASLPSARTPTTHDWQLLSKTWTPRLDERIAFQRLVSSLGGSRPAQNQRGELGEGLHGRKRLPTPAGAGRPALGSLPAQVAARGALARRVTRPLDRQSSSSIAFRSSVARGPIRGPGPSRPEKRDGHEHRPRPPRSAARASRRSGQLT